MEDTQRTLDTTTFSLQADFLHPQTTMPRLVTLLLRARLRFTSTKCTRWKVGTRGCRSARGSGSPRTGTASRRRAPGRGNLARQKPCPGHSQLIPLSPPTPPHTSTQTTRGTHTQQDAPPSLVLVRPCLRPQPWTNPTHQAPVVARQTQAAMKREVGRTLFVNSLYPSCLP